MLEGKERGLSFAGVQEDTDIYREDGHVTMEAEIGVLQPQAKCYPRLPANHQKPGRVKEESPTRTSRESTALLTPRFQTSMLKSYKIIHFCCFKSPSLCCFIMAALGNKYTLSGQPVSAEMVKEGRADQRAGHL